MMRTKRGKDFVTLRSRKTGEYQIMEYAYYMSFDEGIKGIMRELYTIYIPPFFRRY